MNRYRLTRMTRKHVWIINMAFGPCCRARQRGLSRRIPRDEFDRDWVVLLTTKEVVRRP